MTDDPYINPETGVLRNIPGLKTQRELDAYEAEQTCCRLAELDDTPLPGNFDAEHLKAIHQYIFQDVYDWAGQARTINAPKIDGSKATRFTQATQIDKSLVNVCGRLDSATAHTLTREQFIDKSAALLGDLNHIHTFREGNGRAQKCFLEHFAAQAGQTLDFSLVGHERMAAASEAFETRDSAPMKHLIDDASDLTKQKQLGDVISFFDKEGFDWQHRGLACVQPGQTYSGTMVGRKGNDLLFHDAQRGGAWIGDIRDVGWPLVSGEKFTYTAGTEAFDKRLAAPAAQSGFRVAVNLTQHQTELLIANHLRLGDVKDRTAAMFGIVAKDEPLTIMDGRVDLHYAHETKQLYAVVEQDHDKPALERHLRRLVEKHSPAKERTQGREDAERE